MKLIIKCTRCKKEFEIFELSNLFKKIYINDILDKKCKEFIIFRSTEFKDFNEIICKECQDKFKKEIEKN